ncbi:MAG: terminase large subunit domain-containing protein, partial [Casimicrobium sp.]
MDGAAFPLLECQKALVQDPSRFIIAMASRQTGKSSTVALKIVDQIHEAMTQQRKLMWVILSSSERTSKEVMAEAIRKHSYAYQLGAADVQEAAVKSADGSSQTQLEVRYPNGSRVIALPANPDTARGYSANLWLDEFAVHQQSREIWGAAFPLVSANHSIIVTSTPKGKANKFFELWHAQRGSWSRHQWDIHTAVAQGLNRNIAELKDNLGDDELWAQEYLIQFAEDASSWLSWDLINTCEHTHAGVPNRYEGNECVVGIDIATGKVGSDLFVVEVLERVGDIWWHREEVAKRADFAEQDAIVARIFKQYRVSKCYV